MMNWKDNEEELDAAAEEPKKVTRYVAVTGVTFTKPKHARFEAGEDIPELYMKAVTPDTFDWLLNRRGAVEKIER